MEGTSMYITTRSSPIRTPACLTWLAVVASALVALNVNTVAYAQDYPDRPVKLVAPYPPGGGTDIAARWVAGKLSDGLKQTMFVDNLPGANGNLGTDYIAKAAPDGYVVGMATPGPVTVGRSLYPDLPYDPQKDLEPIILANESPIVLAVNPAISAKSLKELVALAKSKPGKLSAALVSTGSVPYLLTEMLKMSAGINSLDVPYKGGAPATLDVISGQVDMLFSVLPLILPNIKAGQLRPLVIASNTRSPLLPDVPTTAEEGYGDVTGSAWNGIVAPAGTPRAIIDRLNEETSQILMTPDTKQRFDQLGMQSVGGTAQDFAKFLQAESQKWGKVIAEAHLQAP
jgi:tripartite-type tricarboxylate transporter receptor subunit TctC